jgi:hypothetical protein
VVSAVQAGELGKPSVERVRSKELEVFDRYLKAKQYDHLMPWDVALKKNGEHVPIRDRKPRIILNFAQILTDRVAGKLVGSRTFPQVKVEDDPDTEEFAKAIIRSSRLKSAILDPIRKMGASGSSLIRFLIVEGALKIECYPGNHCYPQFSATGELSSVMVRYVYLDREDKDFNGKEKEKWFRLDLGEQTDILYDTPEYKPGVDPFFSPVSEVTHGLGFVQAEWLRTTEEQNSPDGASLIGGILDFIDELNYNLSQSSQAVGYNQDPQLVMSGMDEDEITMLIRSATKGWNLGRDGQAQFLESSMNGVAAAQELRDKVRHHIQDIARVLLLDPEKMVGHAQSAKAMEVLHGPFVELIEELRPVVEARLTSLVQKMSIAVLVQARRGQPTPFVIPPGFVPKSFDFNFDWPPIFPPTMQDLMTKVQWVTSATAANLVSRETGTRILAKDFGVEDIEMEVQKVNEQPVINPFGGF